MARDDFQQALINRSLRNVKLELEFLADAKIITSGQLHEIISALPESAPSSTTTTTTSTTRNPLTNAASALPALPLRNNSTPQANGHTTNNNTNATIPQSYNEKQNGFHAQTPPVTTNAPPPAYPTAPAPPLASATALYQYNAQDAGDLQLAPNDRVAVTEYMNAEWWKGRNERTGQEGIFPRSYVKVEEKGLQQQQGSGYGNMPLDVSQSGGGGKEGNGEPSKVEQNGKKFGKKLGNAAIFGAGATIGGKIVNGIF